MTTRKYRNLNRSKGKVYFRCSKLRMNPIRMQAAEGTPAFDREYDELTAALMAGKFGDLDGAKRGRPSRMLNPDKYGDDEPLIGTVNGKRHYKAPAIGWFVEKWKASDVFCIDPGKRKLTDVPLALGTQERYRIGLDLMRDGYEFNGEKREGLMHLPLHDLNPRNANAYIQRIKRERTPSAAEVQRMLLSNIWKFAVKNYPDDFNYTDQRNPIGGIESPYKVQQEHKPWPDDVQDRFVAACNPNVHLGFWLLLCTGQRISDVCALTWSQYDGTHIRLTQQKDRFKQPMRIKVPKKLKVLLDKRERVHDCILTHQWNQPYAGDSLWHRMKHVLRKIGEPDYTPHGLRKNAGIMLAMNGANVETIMAILGHRSPKMALYYTRLANQAALADRGADIMDRVFAERDAARVKARRTRIKAVR